MPLRAQKYGLHPKLNQNWRFYRLLMPEKPGPGEMLTGSRAGKGTQGALRVQVLEETTSLCSSLETGWARIQGTAPEIICTHLTMGGSGDCPVCPNSVQP